MYLIEFIIKKLTKRKNKEELFQDLNELNNPEDDYENCEHLFMPIDSTNEVLSCTKCGLVVKRNELKNKNFFES